MFYISKTEMPRLICQCYENLNNIKTTNDGHKNDIALDITLNNAYLGTD